MLIFDDINKLEKKNIFDGFTIGGLHWIERNLDCFLNDDGNESKVDKIAKTYIQIQESTTHENQLNDP